MRARSLKITNKFTFALTKLMSLGYRASLPFCLWFLLPFSWLFACIVISRHFLYQQGWLRSKKFSVPVIIVGNITVGGTGKTPFVIWLAQWLRAQGYHPGIISRGVGGKQPRIPQQINVADHPGEVGDEALLLAQQSGCPVVICRNKVAAVERLLAQTDGLINVVISDDGLQHYRLQRDIEIAIIDGVRGFGNQQLLPAGPLREPLRRLQQVDMVVTNGESTTAYPGSFLMQYFAHEFVSLVTNEKISFAAFAAFLNVNGHANNTVHAVAGIGHPERFFLQLRQAGLVVVPHVFPDHHLYQPQDLAFQDRLPIIMTEKDAVKCTAFADERYWYMPVQAQVSEICQQVLLEKLAVLG
ncbi:MAG TPA: tetraacyldisaccharide 4'-kinase [Gammaproteobacteria bacterium]|jgi:tetraacyldisaccharide 4'-kinase|nr:tetraacyldisaccharide 4'-kinase [Gammaproteobacteria bacterium]